MENRLSGTPHVPTVPLSELRDLFRVGNTKEKIAPELKEALHLLQLKDLDGLENHFVATDAFLKPWSYFRDKWFLIQTDPAKCASPPGQLKPTGILWYYTSFLEGELRYDARCDDSTSIFTFDETKYGTFDDEDWGVEEHEKMLYAWLLQDFRVGKTRNPFGFKYFEYRNVVTAWKNVFVPIINAVRDSYDVRGRRHYGRLATFIEDRYPSRLAFPEGNVTLPAGGEGVPYRMVSLSRAQPWAESSPQTAPREHRSTTKKEYAEFEQELRVVYPKYGQVVERPKFTTRMEDWLASQKQRSQQKKRARELNGKKSLNFTKRDGRGSPLSFSCKGIEEDKGERSQGPTPPRRAVTMKAFASSPKSPASLKQSPRTPTRKVPYGMYGYADIPEDDMEHEKSHERWRPGIERLDSDNIYSSIRDSNPFTESGPASFKESGELKQRASWGSEGFSMPQKSAIPVPLFDQGSSARKPDRGPPAGSSFVRAINEAKSRAPSYEGNGYERDITPSFLEGKPVISPERRDHTETQPGQSTDTQEHVHPRDERGIAYHIPQLLPWPGNTQQFQPQSKAKWPSASANDDEETLPPPPAIPAKNPQRYNSTHSLRSAESTQRSSLQPPAYPSRTLGPRIISVENIRAHTTISPQASEEDLANVDEEEEKKAEPPQLLKTYNSHMFPRKGTPLSAETERYEAGGEYELRVLKQHEKE